MTVLSTAGRAARATRHNQTFEALVRQTLHGVPDLPGEDRRGRVPGGRDCG